MKKERQYILKVINHTLIKLGREDREFNSLNLVNLINANSVSMLDNCEINDVKAIYVIDFFRFKINGLYRIVDKTRDTKHIMNVQLDDVNKVDFIEELNKLYLNPSYKTVAMARLLGFTTPKE